MTTTKTVQALAAPPPDADAALLATLGYRQQFQRCFTKFEVFGIAFSIMGLMPSIATTLIYAIPSGGPLAMVWAWPITCFFILLSGLALGDLASSMPTSGGLYYWTYAMSNKRCRRLLCWIVGYANTLSTTSAVASIDWGVAQMIMAAANISTDGNFIPTNWQFYLTYLAILLCHAVLTSIGTRVLARMQTFATVLTGGLAVAVIIALCVATPSEYRNTADYALTGWYNETGWNNGAAFLLSMLMASWTVASYDSCVHISEEASNAATAVPLGIFASILLSGVLGTAILIAISFNMGTDLESIVNTPSGVPLAEILLNSLGKSGCLGIWSVICISQFMMGASMNLASSRQVFAFSRDGALPFSGWVYRINDYTKTPVNSAWYSTAISAALGLLGLANEVAVGAVFSLSIIGASIAYGIPVIARLTAPKEQFKPGPWYLGDFWSPIVGYVSTAYLIAISVIVCLPGYIPTSASEFNYASVVTAAVLGFSVAWYYFPKYGGYYWFEGPKTNLEIIEKVIEVPSSSDSEHGSDKGKMTSEVGGTVETYELNRG